jgi:hypothetical protein
MNTNEDRERNFIIIGGCHVAGFGAEGNRSFIDIVENKLNLKCVFKKSNFELKHINRLNFILDNYKSNLIFVQLGNNEFNASLMHLFPKKNVNITAHTSKITSVDNNTFNWRNNFLCFFGVSFVKLMLGYVIWMNEKKENKKYLLEFQDIINKKANKTFVIISPFPTNYRPSNITRRNAGKLYRYLFDDYPNVIFIDSYDQFSVSNRMFFDRYHLNAKGHEQLGLNIGKVFGIF